MSLLGRLEDLSLTDIVQIVFLSRRTGVLEIVDTRKADGSILHYERLGYVRTATPPQRLCGTITLRGRPLAVDDTLLEYEKPVDSAAARSS